jgi:peptidoglycan/LPS O-acetylase OafA/YrhL
LVNAIADDCIDALFVNESSGRRLIVTRLAGIPQWRLRHIQLMQLRSLRSVRLMQSIGGVLRAHKGVGPGFDALRLILAVSVLFVHSAALWRPGNPDPDLMPLLHPLPIPTWALSTALVPLFFALSGFLVAGSAENLPLRDFIANRALRIVPALLVEVTLCGLLLGPLVTTLPIHDYFSDPAFSKYFLNVLGWIHYELPGVFRNNPETYYVNGSLWTVPHEFSVYIALAASVWLGVFERRRLLLVSVAALFGVAIATYLATAHAIHFPGSSALNQIFVTRGAARLVPVFFTGVLFYCYRDRIPFHGGIAAAATAVYLGATCLVQRDAMLNPVGVLLTAPLFAYVVVWIGLSPHFSLRGRHLWIVPIGMLTAGDFSYGVYLYGYPLQQSLLHFFPGTWNTLGFFGASLAVVVSFAVLSWYLIERPILRLRRHTRSGLRTEAVTKSYVSIDSAAIATRIAPGSRDAHSSPTACTGTSPSLDSGMNQSNAEVLVE